MRIDLQMVGPTPAGAPRRELLQYIRTVRVWSYLVVVPALGGERGLRQRGQRVAQQARLAASSSSIYEQCECGATLWSSRRSEASAACGSAASAWRSRRASPRAPPVYTNSASVELPCGRPGARRRARPAAARPARGAAGAPRRELLQYIRTVRVWSYLVVVPALGGERGLRQRGQRVAQQARLAASSSSIYEQCECGATLWSSRRSEASAACGSAASAWRSRRASPRAPPVYTNSASVELPCGRPGARRRARPAAARPARGAAGAPRRELLQYIRTVRVWSYLVVVPALGGERGLRQRGQRVAQQARLAASSSSIYEQCECGATLWSSRRSEASAACGSAASAWRSRRASPRAPPVYTNSASVELPCGRPGARRRARPAAARPARGAAGAPRRELLQYIRTVRVWSYLVVVPALGGERGLRQRGQRVAQQARLAASSSSIYEQCECGATLWSSRRSEASAACGSAASAWRSRRASPRAPPVYTNSASVELPCGRPGARRRARPAAARPARGAAGAPRRELLQYIRTVRVWSYLVVVPALGGERGLRQRGQRVAQQARLAASSSSIYEQCECGATLWSSRRSEASAACGSAASAWRSRRASPRAPPVYTNSASVELPCGRPGARRRARPAAARPARGAAGAPRRELLQYIRTVRVWSYLVVVPALGGERGLRQRGQRVAQQARLAAQLARELRRVLLQELAALRAPRRRALQRHDALDQRLPVRRPDLRHEIRHMQIRR
ncbi:unnamed protein product [Arctia plantaginis]|uniref:Uncharacterized protein n=1 Tax=Arctia plantaginis TaxID=874455 RepID=A0A8S0ZH07_ARCPL|nr:unnamed protein product [Arctia plantaginis]